MLIKLGFKYFQCLNVQQLFLTTPTVSLKPEAVSICLVIVVLLFLFKTLRLHQLSIMLPPKTDRDDSLVVKSLLKIYK